MGTVVSFSVLAGSEHALEAIDEACGLLHALDSTFSTWLQHSPMSRYRSGQIAIDEAPEELACVLACCERARELSRGWFDPWAMPGGVDPTGLVKGWAVERCLDLLQARGISAALINAGGDVGVLGAPSPGQPWRVGIRHPWREDALARVILTEVAVATSGHYERGFQLIDPFSGELSCSVASATVTGPSLALADALATAAAVAGPVALEIVAGIEGYEAYLILPDGTELVSDGLTSAPTNP
jgi:thiamine biosynthesis lipoprotein